MKKALMLLVLVMFVSLTVNASPDRSKKHKKHKRGNVVNTYGKSKSGYKSYGCWIF
jgi:hypothetical protein